MSTVLGYPVGNGTNILSTIEQCPVPHSWAEKAWSDGSGYERIQAALRRIAVGPQAIHQTKEAAVSQKLPPLSIIGMGNGGSPVEFAKMHGSGNDYIFINCMAFTPDDLSQLARQLSDRHFGVGGDGLICICPSNRADFRMRMFNADGSEGAMCGNGIRCLGKYVYDKGLTGKTSLRVETAAGERGLKLMLRDGQVAQVTVDMGIPAVSAPIEIDIKGRCYTSIPVSMGNPHSVVVVDDPAALDLEKIGPIFERWPYFQDRTNTEFVHLISRNRLGARVWERGSGETLACGTGACAVVAALSTARLCQREAAVILPGGELQVCWNPENGHIYLTGPAVTVFEGKTESVGEIG